MSEWQPIETAPRDRFILLYVPGEALECGPVTMGIWFPDGEDDRDDRGRFKKKHSWFPATWSGWLGVDGDTSPSWCEPTHWQPLPSPPSS